MLIQIASRVPRDRGESPANLHSCKSGDLLTKTLKTRDHSRQLNEISIESDDGINEIDKLRKRFQESVEILEVRESNRRLHATHVSGGEKIPADNQRVRFAQRRGRESEEGIIRLVFIIQRGKSQRQGNRSEFEEQSSELDRLKRLLNAKEEVERNQIEAVHTLIAKVKKQEKEVLWLQEKLDNTTHKMNAYKTSLDVAKVELAETKLNFSAAEELKQVFDSAGESCRLSA
ncbi:hypothetical protein KQX54_001468 [Cotesia glomerata]|uniref:Uncharacterized protein n=1 Tax=Cotesia glomerata TaxID=32391 RepID=A0AAV7IC25_COTGL|nr:hypothetical protein KQX54_001468 [Cotesia glomerata]